VAIQVRRDPFWVDVELHGAGDARRQQCVGQRRNGQGSARRRALLAAP
jgi:hypothetical protein